MAKSKPKFLIIGSGWYGCHAASLIKDKGYEFNLVDKTNQIFVASSSKNQNRLHIGFHYPRSENTRKESVEGYKKFIKKYPKLSFEIKDNIYCISKDSVLDYPTYCKIMCNEKKYFEKIDDLSNLQRKLDINIDLIDGAIKTKERLINPEKVKNHFDKLLKGSLIKINTAHDVEKITKNYDYVLDCTFGQRENFNDFKYELSICLMYKAKIKNYALTVMDGPFFSIFPYDLKENLYTLTHVNYTPVCVSDDINHINKVKNSFRQKHLARIIRNMEKETSCYIPNFNQIFSYNGYYLSTKTKTSQKSDNRSLFWNIDDKKISFAGGKITGIFSMEEVIKNQIIKNL